MRKVAVIMGSASDLPTVRKAADTLDSFGVPCEVHVWSAHRTPLEVRRFAETARESRPPGGGRRRRHHPARHRAAPEIHQPGRH